MRLYSAKTAMYYTCMLWAILIASVHAMSNQEAPCIDLCSAYSDSQEYKHIYNHTHTTRVVFFPSGDSIAAAFMMTHPDGVPDDNFLAVYGVKAQEARYALYSVNNGFLDEHDSDSSEASPAITALARAGDHVLVGRADGKVFTCQEYTDCTQMYCHHEGPITSIAADEQHVAVGFTVNHTGFIATNKSVFEVGKCPQLSMHKETIAVADPTYYVPRNAVHLYNLQGKWLKTINMPSSLLNMHAVALCNSGNTIVCVGAPTPQGKGDVCVMHNEGKLSIFGKPYSKHQSSNTMRCAVDDAGKYIVVVDPGAFAHNNCHKPGAVYLYNAITHALLTKYYAPDVSDAALSPSGGMMVIANKELFIKSVSSASCKNNATTTKETS